MKIIACATFLLLAACGAAGKQYAKNVNAWKAHNVNDLIRKWGAPARTFTAPDGTVIYEYIYEESGNNRVTVHVGNDFDPGRNFVNAYNNASPSKYWCKTQFFTVNEKITSVRGDGNYCLASERGSVYAPPFESPTPKSRTYRRGRPPPRD